MTVLDAIVPLFRFQQRRGRIGVLSVEVLIHAGVANRVGAGSDRPVQAPDDKNPHARLYPPSFRLCEQGISSSAAPGATGGLPK